MKDEFKRKIISKFVGLKSKMCSLIDADGKENRIAKGINIKILLKTQGLKNILMFGLIKK